MTENKLSHSDLIDFACIYLRRKTIRKKGVYEYNPECSRIFTELVTVAGETPDAIGFCSGVSYLVEAKTSMSDFYADKKKPWRINPEMGMGNFKYFISEKGLISVDKLPDKWGLLEVENGRVVVSKKAEFSECDKRKEIVLFMSYIRRLESGEIKLKQKGVQNCA